VLTGSQFLLDAGELAEPQRAVATRITRSARRMNQMVADLLDFTWGRLGSGIPISRSATDLDAIVREAIDEMVVLHPEARLQFTASGDLHGQWDPPRIGQVITNLLNNALQHGTPGTPINVTAEGEPTAVVLRIHNHGRPISRADQLGLFSPFKRFGADKVAKRDSTGNLGLGLYITERIVTAHAGTIDVRSSPEAGTLFTVRLPR
jgi:phosphoserine phosphatase RsbU/P